MPGVRAPAGAVTCKVEVPVPVAMVAGTNVPVAPVGTPSTDRVMADWDALLDVDRFSATWQFLPPLRRGSSKG